MNPNAFTYYAFVSYSHKDEKWARWIQTALERYRLPAAVRKEAGKALPERIRPVFRDATDLGVGKLADNLRQELEQSKFLIVVCSPNSALPNTEGKHWVNEEVVRFCELGRADRVIPVIVGGTKETAYCPKLEEEDILGLDATKHPRERILNDLVAKILGLRPDELWRREERRLRAKRRRRIFGLCLATALVAIGGIAAWDSTRTVCNHYADYVDSFGLPEGIFPLGKAELEHRNFHYRFEYRGLQKAKDSPHADSADWSLWNAVGFRRRLVRVVQANSRGYPCQRKHPEFSDRPQAQDFEYDHNARLRQIRQRRFDKEGLEPHLEKRIELHDDEGVVNGLLKFFSMESQRSVVYSEASPAQQLIWGGLPAKSEITCHSLLRDRKGRTIQRLFLNSAYANVPNGDGLFGFSYEYDKLGRKTGQWNLFRHGNCFESGEDKRGFSGTKYEYSNQCIMKVAYVGMNGKPVLHEDGFAEMHMQYDKCGNETKRTYFGADGMLTLNKNGYAEKRQEYDECGELTKESYFGTDGRPILQGDGYAEKHLEYDGRGNKTRETYFGVFGKPTRCVEGFAEVRMEYDEGGNGATISFFGEDGNPTLFEGAAEVRAEYDKRGNRTRLACFGVDGKPVLGVEGFAEVRTEYDKHGNRIKQSCFGTDGKPTLHRRGFAETQLEYDTRGNLLKESYFGVDGKPVLNKHGFSEAHVKHDERGNRISESYFGVDGNPVLGKDGFAEVCTAYDEYGNIIRQWGLGVDGKPDLNERGIAELRWEYDKRGNMIKEAYFGVDGKPTASVDGFAEMRMEYDDRGNILKGAFFSVDGKPTSRKDGFAEVRAEYDERGNMTKEAYFGVDGNPVLSEEGFAEVRTVYDERGNRIKQSCLGVDGNPILHKRGFAEVRLEYDKHGNITKESYFGVDGKPTASEDGFAEARLEYDEEGNIIKEAYYGVGGEQIFE